MKPGVRVWLGLAIAVPVAAAVQPVMELARPDQVRLAGGLLGTSAQSSCERRLKRFISSEASEPIALFGPEAVAKNYAGDWNGEHAGKWLYTAARAAARTGDARLAANVRRVAAYLVSRQAPDGYLGTYAPDAPSRMTSPLVAGQRTWDVWVHSYIILGLLEANRYFPDPQYVAAARRVGDLCYRLFVEQKRSLGDMGNHEGLSATILLEPAVELYRATSDRRYLDLAAAIVGQMEALPRLQVLSRAIKGRDLQEIGDGKIYQLLWNFVGLAKLYAETGDPRFQRAVERAWTNVAEHHLTPGGGPWGGVAGHYEVFNPQGYFNPEGFVETCSTMSWIHLNRELLRLSGDAKYADHIELALYNSLLGAQDPNGEDWSYFSFPNGPRSHTYYWACCKSSGALALEEIAPLVAGIRAGGIAVNLYTESEIRLRLTEGIDVGLAVRTAYPREGTVRIQVNPGRPASFPLYLRVPSWAEDARISVNGETSPEPVLSGSYVKLLRTWRKGDEIALELPLRVRVVSQAYTVDHHGQEIVHVDYAAVVRGPLVYATGPGDGFKKLETIKLPKANPEILFAPVQTPAGFDGPALHLNVPGGDPVQFLPYYEAGGRGNGTWRSTWLQVAWQ